MQFSGGMIDLSEILSKSRSDPEDIDSRYDKQMATLNERATKFGRAHTQRALREAFLAITRENEFQPGDILQFKSGLENGKIPPMAGIMVFIRDLDLSQPGLKLPDIDFSEPLAVALPDCVVGVLLSHGAVCEYAGTKRYLEHAPEPTPEELAEDLLSC